MNVLDRNLNQAKAQVFKDNLKTHFDSTVKRSEDEMVFQEVMNLNSGYLLSVLRLMDEFTIIKVNGITGQGKYNTDYYYQMFEILEMIVDVINPKMLEETAKHFDDRLKIIYDDIERVFVVAPKGVFIDHKKARDLRRTMGGVFRDILKHMEARGMLTFKKENPMHAMSKFHD